MLNNAQQIWFAPSERNFDEVLSGTYPARRCAGHTTPWQSRFPAQGSDYMIRNPSVDEPSILETGSQVFY